MSDRSRKKPGDQAGRASEVVTLTNRDAQWRSYTRRSPGQADRDYHGGEPRDRREPDSCNDMEE